MRRIRRPHWVVCLTLSLLLIWPWPVWAQPATPLKEVVAVLEFEPSGATKVEAGAITDRLREELLRAGRYTVVDRGQIEAVLAEQALQQTGCTTQECAVEVGQILGVRKIISGRVTKLGEDQWLVSAQMIDVETTETQIAESLRHRGDLFTLVDLVIVDLAHRLSEGPAAPQGSAPLVKKAPAPVAPSNLLAPAVPPAGSAPEQSGAPTTPMVRPPEPLAKVSANDGGWPWWVWTLIGVGVLGAAAAAGSGGDAPSCPSAGGCGQITAGW
jgi:hypothetical protein